MKYEDQITRLQSILSRALQVEYSREHRQQLRSETNLICDQIFADFKSSSSPELRRENGMSETYFDEKLCGMKYSVLAALGYEREGASENKIVGDFEHFSYLVASMMRILSR